MIEGAPQPLSGEKLREDIVEKLSKLRTELNTKELAMHTEMARPTGVDTVSMQLEVDRLRRQVEAKELELARFDGRAPVAPKPIEE
jgi:hypothetical protein